MNETSLEQPALEVLLELAHHELRQPARLLCALQERRPVCAQHGIGGDEADNSAAYAGAAYVFARAGSAWAQQAYVKASNTAFFDRFVSSLSLSGDGSTLAVGAFLEDSIATGIDGDSADNAASAAGAVYVY